MCIGSHVCCSSSHRRLATAKPIDILAKYIHDAEDGNEVQPEEPYAMLPTLTVDELEDLHEDIKVYMEIERVCGKILAYFILLSFQTRKNVLEF